MELHEAVRNRWQMTAAVYDQKVFDALNLQVLAVKDITMFSNLHFHISHWAILKIHKQYEGAKTAFDKDPRQSIPWAAVSSFTKQLGLPNWKMLYNLLQTNKPIELSHVDIHHWVRKGVDVSEGVKIFHYAGFSADPHLGVERRRDAPPH